MLKLCNLNGDDVFGMVHCFCLCLCERVVA